MTQVVLRANWWALGLRGLAAVFFGLLTFLLPGLTLLLLTLLFGTYCLISGLLTLIAAFRSGKGQPRWWALALEGGASTLAGVFVLGWPGFSSLALLHLVALWAIVSGGLQIVTAIRLRKQITGEWVLMLGGLLSVGFGVLLVLMPIVGALAIAWWIGSYAFVVGILLAILAFRLRPHSSGVGSRQSQLPATGHMA